MKRIPSLDGLRAVAICLVLLSHVLFHVVTHTRAQELLLAVLTEGEPGTAVFFVLSGFLVTILLLKEKQKSGSIKISAFYMRRVYRILPAFAVYLGVVAVLVRLGTITVPGRQFLHVLTFTMDYVNPKSWWIGHFWSLSVQERFYLLWPLAFIFCSRKTLTRIAAGIVIGEPFIRVANRILVPSAKDKIFYMGHTRADMLMFGCLVALLYENPRFIKFVEGLFRKRAPALAAVYLFLLSPVLIIKIRGLYFLTIGYTLQGVCVSVLLLYVTWKADTRLGRFLNAPAVVWVGTLSYSLYLWQQLFIGYDTFTTRRSLIGLLFVVPAALASYYLVEKPMLQVKERYEKRRSSLKMPVVANAGSLAAEPS